MSLNGLVFEGEDIVYRTGKHWVVLAKALIFFVVALAIWASGPALMSLAQFKVPDELEKFLPKIISVAVWLFRYIFFILFTLLALMRFFSYFTLRVGVTEKRLLCDDALFGTFSLDVSKVESIKCEPGMFGGLFGYAKVIFTASSSQRIVLSNIRHPHVLEQAIFTVK